MKDAPADFGAVNVDLVSVQLKYVDDGSAPGGWVVLGTKTGVYNLLEFKMMSGRSSLRMKFLPDG